MWYGARFALPLGLLFLGACGSDSGGTPPQPSDAGSNPMDQGPKPVTYRADIAPMFAGCALCHHKGNQTVIDFNDPFNPMTGIIGRANTWTGKPIVDPGNVENSFLVDKVERTDLDPHTEGNPMPWNIAPLEAAEIAAVRQWIQDGAMNDASFTANVAPIFGDGMSLATRGGKCGYCHSPDSGNPPDLTHPFDPMTGIVNVAGARGARVVPGNPDGSLLVKKIEGQMGVGASMPYQQQRLPAPAIDALKSWIKAGAKND
jgi:hypothetical protein